MVKRGLCSIAMVAALIPFVQPASAQNYKGTPKPTIQEYGPFKNTKSKNTPSTPSSGRCGNPAGNCLFYGGDFVNNPLGSPFLPNGLANENTLLVPGTPYGGATWVPFNVPAGQTWHVTGLFTNNFASYGVLDQGAEPLSVAYWSINEGVFPGNAGTVVDSNTSPASSTPTGRSNFDLNEYTVEVKGLSVVLTSGSYWMTVVPICTNTADPFCEGVFFLSDVEYVNTRPTNAFGSAEPADAAFFDSPAFFLTFDPANGGVGACAGDGCDAFSAGVIGFK
jgi:hypothetical protein